MKVEGIEVVNRRERIELRCRVSSAALAEPFELWFRFPAALAPDLRADRGDPFIPALLPIAMRTGEPLRVELPVSERLLRATGEIQSILRSWDRTLTRVAVEARQRDVPAAGAPAHHDEGPGRTGLFFSLGMDSFYSLVQNSRQSPGKSTRITDLIFVRNYDIPLARSGPGVLHQALGNLERVGQALGLRVLVAETNARDLSDRLVKWNLIYHGAALAAIGLAAGRTFGRIYIAGDVSYARLHPWGCHPVLDPLWSTEQVAFVHDGCGATRVQKASVIADQPVAMETLRVCFQGIPDKYNCGSCEKCIRTMICLHAARALGRCRTLPNRIDLDLLRGLRLNSYVEQTRYEEIIAEMGDSDADREIKGILWDLVCRGRWALAQNDDR